MAVAFDNANGWVETTQSQFSRSHTGAGDLLAAIVWLIWGGGAVDITSASYGGVAVAQIDHTDDSTWLGIALNPATDGLPTGSQTVEVNFDGDAGGGRWGLVTLNGVDQKNGYKNLQGIEATGAGKTWAVETPTDSMALAVHAHRDDGGFKTIAWDPGTERFVASFSNRFASAATRGRQGLTTDIGFSLSGTPAQHSLGAAMAIIPPPTGGQGPIWFMFENARSKWDEIFGGLQAPKNRDKIWQPEPQILTPTQRQVRELAA